MSLQLPNMPGAFPPQPVAMVEHEVLVDSPLFKAVLLPRWRSPEENPEQDRTTHLLFVSMRRYDDTWFDRIVPVNQLVTDMRPVHLVAWLQLSECYRSWEASRLADEVAWIASHKEPKA